jgi:hypothetical protein
MYSWSRSICESQDEFETSKALLYAYLASSDIRGIFAHSVSEITEDAIKAIQRFIMRNVETHKQYFLFYLRKTMLSFETNSNSAHEGTNHGLKYHSVATNPQQSIGRCTSVLDLQAAHKAGNIVRAIFNRGERIELYSNLPTTNDLTRLGHGLVTAQWKQRTNYKISGPKNNAWLCKRVNHTVEETVPTAGALRERLPSMVPRFSRVRTITLKEGILFCSCAYFERHGIPCRHQMKVLDCVHGCGYRGITKEDVKVHWWVQYYRAAIMDPNSEKYRNFLWQSQNDAKGPRLAISEIQVVEDEYGELEQERSKPASQRCLNYSQESCEYALHNFASAVGYFTQETVDYGMDMGGYSTDDANDEISCVDSNEINNAENVIHFPTDVSTLGNMQATAYQLYQPLFKELVAMAQKPEHVQAGLQDLLGVLANMKARTSKRKAADSRSVVSCCTDSTNKRRTHGTNRK